MLYFAGNLMHRALVEKGYRAGIRNRLLSYAEIGTFARADFAFWIGGGFGAAAQTDRQTDRQTTKLT